MEKVRGYSQNLYQREEPHPLGLPLITHTSPEKLNKDISLEAEVAAELLHLRPHKAGGHTNLHAEHFKRWQREAYPGENSKTPPQRELLLCLVDLLHHMWRPGETPQELGWTIMVLIPKGNTNTRVIGLLETL